MLPSHLFAAASLSHSSLCLPRRAQPWLPWPTEQSSLSLVLLLLHAPCSLTKPSLGLLRARADHAAAAQASRCTAVLPPRRHRRRALGSRGQRATVDRWPCCRWPQVRLTAVLLPRVAPPPSSRRWSAGATGPAVTPPSLLRSKEGERELLCTRPFVWQAGPKVQRVPQVIVTSGAVGYRFWCA
jgi:hypothetical protein